MAANLPQRAVATLVRRSFISSPPLSTLSNLVVMIRSGHAVGSLSTAETSTHRVYSGNELPSARRYEWKAVKEYRPACMPACFTKALHNFSEFLLTGNKATFPRLEHRTRAANHKKKEDRDSQTLTAALGRAQTAQELEQSSADSMTTGRVIRWCSRAQGTGYQLR